MITPIPIRRSALTETIPAIGTAVVLTPESYTSWAAMFAAHSTEDDYLLTPGDYRSWGASFDVTLNGIEARRRTIRYYNPDDQATHPVLRRREAIIDTLEFNDISYWHIQGLTLRDSLSQFVVTGDSHHITFDRMLTEGFGTYTYRIFCSDITVQDAVARNGVDDGVDFVAVQVKPQDGIPIARVRVLNCEIYNMRDGFGHTQNATTPTLDVSECLYENVDVYNEPAYFGRTENACDFKTGTTSGTPNRVKNCRFWNHYPGGDAAGDIIPFNVVSRNFIIEGCIMGESTAGLRDEVFVGHPELTTRSIVVNDCYFYEIAGGGTFHAGAIDFIYDATVSSNRFVNCTYLLGSVPNSGYRNGGPAFSGNVKINVPNVRALVGTSPPDSIAVPTTVSAGNVTYAPRAAFAYVRRQWTGPEVKVVSSGSEIAAPGHMDYGVSTPRGGGHLG